MIQRLEASSSYCQAAYNHAQALSVEIPVHGPAGLVFLSLVAHAMVCHSELDLVEYLEAYLDQ
jgi:hypothetical protein